MGNVGQSKTGEKHVLEGLGAKSGGVERETAINRQNAQAPEPRYGWVMVAVAPIFLGIGIGSVFSFSVFLKPLTAELGGLRGVTAFGYAIGALAAGSAGILMGHLADRFSTRPVILAGALGLGWAYFMLARLESAWEFFIYFALLSAFGSGAFQAPLLANVGSWFQRNRGLALGLATGGQALGQGLVPYVSRIFISRRGWRGAYANLGIGSLAVLVPLTMLVRSRPMEKGAPVEKEEAYPVAPVISVTWLSVAVIFCCICMAVPLVHVVALAQDRGIPAVAAASILLPINITGFVGRILFGKVSDHLGGIRAYFLSSAGQTLTVFWFTQMHSLSGFYLAAVLYGLCYGGVNTCIVACVGGMTPVRMRGLSTGIVLLFAWIGMGLGGWQGGIFFDLTGNYTIPFVIAAAAGIVNLAIVGTLYLFFNKRQAALSATATVPA